MDAFVVIGALRLRAADVSTDDSRSVTIGDVTIELRDRVPDVVWTILDAMLADGMTSRQARLWVMLVAADPVAVMNVPSRAPVVWAAALRIICGLYDQPAPEFDDARLPTDVDNRPRLTVIEGGH